MLLLITARGRPGAAQVHNILTEGVLCPCFCASHRGQSVGFGVTTHNCKRSPRCSTGAQLLTEGVLRMTCAVLRLLLACIDVWMHIHLCHVLQQIICLPVHHTAGVLT